MMIVSITRIIWIKLITCSAKKPILAGGGTDETAADETAADETVAAVETHLYRDPRFSPDLTYFHPAFGACQAPVSADLGEAALMGCTVQAVDFQVVD